MRNLIYIQVFFNRPKSNVRLQHWSEQTIYSSHLSVVRRFCTLSAVTAVRKQWGHSCQTLYNACSSQSQVYWTFTSIHFSCGTTFLRNSCLTFLALHLVLMSDSVCFTICLHSAKQGYAGDAENTECFILSNLYFSVVLNQGFLNWTLKERAMENCTEKNPNFTKWLWKLTKMF